MKDRIRQIMEERQMTQQVFADFLGTTSATLSGIFNERNRPTLNIVESIKKKIPDISTEWLLFGTGPMYLSEKTGSTSATPTPLNPAGRGADLSQPMLDFEPQPSSTPSKDDQQHTAMNGVRNTPPTFAREEIKIIDKPQRRVTEIRVFYDDQTWESFAPLCKK